MEITLMVYVANKEKAFACVQRGHFCFCSMCPREQGYCPAEEYAGDPFRKYGNFKVSLTECTQAY